MPTERGVFGKHGEDLACEYLVQHGYEIVTRNFSCRYGEIDIIAVKNQAITFAEVKSRRSLAFGTPGMAVNYNKQMKIKKTALTYLQQQQTYYELICFDVIEVLVINGNTSITHLQQCF